MPKLKPCILSVDAAAKAPGYLEGVISMLDVSSWLVAFLVCLQYSGSEGVIGRLSRSCNECLGCAVWSVLSAEPASLTMRCSAQLGSAQLRRSKQLLLKMSVVDPKICCTAKGTLVSLRTNDGSAWGLARLRVRTAPRKSCPGEAASPPQAPFR